MTAPRAGRLAIVAAVVAAATMALAPAGHACACGAAVAPSGTHATFNHEVAVVHWDGTTETILMQLSMNASTNNVALVVPTPAPAAVAAGDKATFTELDELTAPQIRQRRHWALGFGTHSSAPAGAAARAPQVLSQVHLGPLEATTLAGGDVAGLRKWLADNGYSIRPAVSEALGPYVHDDWSFVALRLTSAAPLVGGLDPVKMTFPSSRMVYPMRLSVAATSPQQVTVFTLSDHRQQRTDADAGAQSIEVQYAGNVAGTVNDPLLRQFTADHGSYLTKILVDIPTPSQITADFAFGNAPNDDAYRKVIVIDHDVAIPVELILLAGFVFGVAATVVVLVLRRRRA